MNQTVTLDKSIDDVLEHFVYVPKQSPVNPQDIPFFLSTRLASSVETQQEYTDSGKISAMQEDDPLEQGDALKILTKYENRAAQLANEYEENMVRF